MTLYDPHRRPAVEAADAICVAHDFLGRCRRWALDRELPSRVEKVKTDLRPEDAAKLHEWIAYLRFVEHTMRELEAGTLDDWFTAPGKGAPGQTTGKLS